MVLLVLEDTAYAPEDRQEAHEEEHRRFHEEQVRAPKTEAVAKREAAPAAKKIPGVGPAPKAARLSDEAKEEHASAILKLATRKSGTTTAEVIEKTGLTAGQARGLITKLQEETKLSRSGGPKQTAYHAAPLQPHLVAPAPGFARTRGQGFLRFARKT